MIARRISVLPLAALIAACVLPAVALAEPASPAQTPASTPPAESQWENTAPLTLRVRDAATGKPITRFGYQLTFEAEGKTQEFTRDAAKSPVESAAGEFVLQAPRTGILKGRITGGAMLGGYHSWKEWRLTTDNTDRILELKVETGVVAAGRVTDVATGKPIAGAKVAPLIFTPPLFNPDEERMVTTDADGRYRVDGVDPSLGVEVMHGDYASTHCRYDANEPKPRVDFAMRLLPLRKGRVVTPDGKPLEGVKITGREGRSAQSGADGTFAIRTEAPLAAEAEDAPAEKTSEAGGVPAPTVESPFCVSVRKPGYFAASGMLSRRKNEPVVITLKPIPVATGRVLDDQGRPLKDFTVAAGEGENPNDWQCPETPISAPDGRFSVRLAGEYADGKSGRFTLYAAAPGFAVSEIVIPATDAGKPLDIRLARGLTLTGSADIPGKFAGGLVVLMPERRQNSCIVADERHALLRKREAALRPDGTFELPALTPGRHLLVARAPGMTPIVRFVEIGSKAESLKLEFRRAGRIVGKLAARATSRESVSFANGEIRWAPDDLDSCLKNLTEIKPMEFHTNEHGEFVIEDVPAGDITLSFPYHVTADMINSENFPVKVTPGATTELRLGDHD